MKNIFASFIAAVDTEYDRRVRAASNVREYHIGGHGHADHSDHDHHDDHAEHDHNDEHHEAEAAHNAGKTEPAAH